MSGRPFTGTRWWDLPPSDRELQALQCASNGLTARRTAEHLGLAYDTVVTIRKRVLVKLGARNITQAVVVAWRQGLIV